MKVKILRRLSFIILFPAEKHAPAKQSKVCWRKWIENRNLEPEPELSSCLAFLPSLPFRES